MAYQEYRAERPTVKIFYQDEMSESALREMMYGLEEEGIPWIAEPRPEQSAVALAFAASSASRLGVGLGINSREAVLHYEKLKEAEPLFRIPTDAPPARMRSLGANAARLVKKLPFKPL